MLHYGCTFLIPWTGVLTHALLVEQLLVELSAIAKRTKLSMTPKEH